MAKTVTVSIGADCGCSNWLPDHTIRTTLSALYED